MRFHFLKRCVRYSVILDSRFIDNYGQTNENLNLPNHMNCPKCAIPLSMTDRQGVEIDFCPQCRGVWLDRGELDKIIERSGFSASPASQPAAPPPQSPPPRDYRRDDDDDDDYRRRSQDGNYGRKKKGFLGDLFDF